MRHYYKFRILIKSNDLDFNGSCFQSLTVHPETIVSENIEESPGHFYSCHVFWSTDAAACLVTTYLIWIETLSQSVGKRQNMNSKNRGTMKMPGRNIKAMQRGLFLQG